MNDLSMIAEEALATWGYSGARLRLIAHRENSVFEVKGPDFRAALRLHRPGYNSLAEIEAELWWCQELAKSGFNTPNPIAAKDGRLLVELDENQVATMITWVEGAPIGVAGEPLPGTDAEQAALYWRIGALLAELHTLTDSFTLPSGFSRHRWDCDGFLGDTPLWGRFWESPGLDAKQRELILTARATAIEDLQQYQLDGADMGLIHADALRENLFADDGSLTLIDFDDSGFGFRLYDLTTALSQSLGDANYLLLQDAILSGYEATRPLMVKDRSRFHLFAMLRTFASLGWAIPRLPNDSPHNKRYSARAVRAAQHYLGQ